MSSESVKGQPKRLAFRLFPMDNGLILVFDKTVKNRFIRLLLQLPPAACEEFAG